MEGLLEWAVAHQQQQQQQAWTHGHANQVLYFFLFCNV